MDDLSTLPPDPVREFEAVTILAGDGAKDRTRSKWRKRLRVAVADGLVTKYERPGKCPVYSQALVEAWGARIPANGRQGRRTVAVPSMLSVEQTYQRFKAADRKLSRKTIRTRARDGWCRARVIRGAWYFEEKLIEAAVEAAVEKKPRAPGGRLVDRPCGACGRTLKRYTSQIEASRSGRFYCTEADRPGAECFAKKQPELLREGLNRRNEQAKLSRAHAKGLHHDEPRADCPVCQGKPFREIRRPNHSAVMVRIWPTTYDGKAAAERVSKIHRSPTSRVKRRNGLRAAHGLAPLSKEQEREEGTRARSKAQDANPAALEADAQKARAAEFHARGLGVAEIAHKLHAAVPTVERYLRESGRSERSPGRREARQRRRIVEHLEQAGGSDERRSLQRATGLSAPELGARLLELGAEVFHVNGRPCVRLVSEKTITPSLAA